MQKRRVVITGMGALSPIGNNLSDYWNGLVNGVSGSAPITYFDTTNFKTKFACEIKNFDVLDYLDKKEIKRIDPFAQYALIVAEEAINDAALNLDRIDKNKIGTIWGTGVGGLITLQKELSDFFTITNKTPKFNPFFIPKIICDIAPGMISIKYGFKGPNFTTVSACASSANAIIDSANYIRMGYVDVVVTGGSEAAITQCGIGGFNALHALSTRNDDPKSASRPFDKDRDGFVLGEGAGALILEDYEHAKKRGAKIYAELSGIGLSADAYHITAPHPKGEGAISVMQNCIKDASLQPNEIDAINMHGTSTNLGDIAEIIAVKEIFKEQSYKMSINSTKSMTGHLLGAAGVIESIASILSIHNGIIPPTINFNELDEKIDPKINFVFNKAKKREINTIISNTFGFGGHNACLLFKKMD